MKFAVPMIARWTFLLTLLLFSNLTTSAFGQEPSRNQSGWRATVECDTLTVYAQMSAESRVVAHLKRGDVVRIDLEFIATRGAWCSVAEWGRRPRLGYVQSKCLEREQVRTTPVWQAVLPPQKMHTPEQPQRADLTTPKHSTREEIEEEVDRVVASKLRAALQLANGSDQTVRRETFLFDDQASIVFLPSFGVGLTGFHRRVGKFEVPFARLPAPFATSAVPSASAVIFARSPFVKLHQTSRRTIPFVKLRSRIIRGRR